MNKIIVLILSLFSIFSVSAQTTVMCGDKKELLVVEKSQPISFSRYVDSGTGFLIKVTSQKKFVVGVPYEEYYKGDKVEYILKISERGNVEFNYSLGDTLPVKVFGVYEYRTVGDQDCPQTKSISEWRFIRRDSPQ